MMIKRPMELRDESPVSLRIIKANLEAYIKQNTKKKAAESDVKTVVPKKVCASAKAALSAFPQIRRVEHSGCLSRAFLCHAVLYALIFCFGSTQGTQPQLSILVIFAPSVRCH